MWDEFTEFFLHNAGLDGLQELAHFAAKAPFYFILATHRPPDVLERGRADEWRKTRDRFKALPYIMEQVTTNTLMGRVLQVMPHAEDEWGARRDNLWAGVRPYVSRLLDTSGRQLLREYLGVVPLHPYAGYILTSIAQQFSSANRTVFRFMKAPGAFGFPAFLATHPEADWHWYTADGLWDYFFSAIDSDTPQEFREGISYYQSRRSEINDPSQLRALKATMLLIGLERALPGEERIKPTRANLGALFSGTPLREQLDQVMEALTKADLVRRIGTITGSGSHYTIPQATIDHDRLRKIRASLTGFDSLLGRDGTLGTRACNAIEGALPERLKRRLALAVVSSVALHPRPERAIPPAAAYQIPAVLIVSENDEAVVSARTFLQTLSVEYPETLWVLLDDSFGSAPFAQYQEDAAYAQYYAENKDDRNARYHRDRCREMIADWLRKLTDARLSSWVGGYPTQLAGIAGIQGAIENAVALRFPYRPELILPTDPLFKGSGFGVSGAQVGLGIRERGAPYDQVLDALSALCTGAHHSRRIGSSCTRNTHSSG